MIVGINSVTNSVVSK